MSQRKSVQGNRRTFLKKTAAAAAVAGVSTPLSLSAGGFHHSVDDVLKVGLVGCGGRGTGAAINAANADPNVKITALADAFADRIKISREGLAGQLGERLAVTDDTCFDGFDCADKLIATDVDVVLLCQPPHFRPESLRAAIKAGKHVFCEKPVAVDVPGAMSVLETCQNAGDRNIVSGLCWRYDLAVREVMNRIQEGEIGRIVNIQENYLTSELWHRGRDPKWSEMEYQMRNWLYFAWLSGDITAEQHIHSLDKAVWLNGDQPPAVCYGVGGRQKRTGAEFGNIYDHFGCVFEWESGVRCFSFCRQMNGCFNETDDHVFGTEGTANVLKFETKGKSGPWEYNGPKPSMYDVEHQFLFRAIREGKPINNGNYMVYSTMMALMGRDACYTGKRLKWEDYVKDTTRLGPTEYKFGDYDAGPVPIPGRG